MSGQGTGNRAALWLRWIARGLGALVAGFWVLIGLLEAFAGADSWTVESAMLVGLFVAAALAVAMAWRGEGSGGILVMLVGAVYGVFAWVTAGHNKLFAVAITGIPYLVVGTLFLASWFLARRVEAVRG